MSETVQFKSAHLDRVHSQRQLDLLIVFWNLLRVGQCEKFVDDASASLVFRSFYRA